MSAGGDEPRKRGEHTRCSASDKTRSRAANNSRIPCTTLSFRLSSSLVIGGRAMGLIPLEEEGVVGVVTALIPLLLFL